MTYIISCDELLQSYCYRNFSCGAWLTDFIMNVMRLFYVQGVDLETRLHVIHVHVHTTYMYSPLFIIIADHMTYSQSHTLKVVT